VQSTKPVTTPVPLPCLFSCFVAFH
jgi:hypothetical protein